MTKKDLTNRIKTLGKYYVIRCDTITEFIMV